METFINTLLLIPPLCPMAVLIHLGLVLLQELRT
jgi:hypothetical protein